MVPFLPYTINRDPLFIGKNIQPTDLPWFSQTIPGLNTLGHRGFVYSDDPFSEVGPLNPKKNCNFHEYLWFWLVPDFGDWFLPIFGQEKYDFLATTVGIKFDENSLNQFY